VGQVWRRTAEHVPQEGVSAPLPRFELPTLEPVDWGPAPPSEPRRLPQVDSSPSRDSWASSEEIRPEDILEDDPSIEVLSIDLEDELEIEVDAEEPLKAAVDVPHAERRYPSPLITVAPQVRPPSGELPPHLSQGQDSPAPHFLIRSLPLTNDRPVDEARKGRITPSIVPVAIDFALGAADSPFAYDPNPARRKLRRRLAIAAVAVAGLFAVGVALRPKIAKFIAPRAALAATVREPLAVARVAVPPPETAAPPPAPPKNEATSSHRAGVASIDVANLPQASVGTVTLAAAAAEHRLFVDGVVRPRGEAVVSCGKHRVKVGSRGRTRIVDVPCGGDVAADL
jgi:hypothetical protein